MTKETVKTIQNAELCEPDKVIVPVHCTFLMSSIIMCCFKTITFILLE